ncbi:cytochrome P450 [Candidatus Poriferisodalis sp.]|uniref:cytochrome P450 n=1 Tax=Candidatus Poriferisodalis sp. TaxID=3101277 RepID=UPI003B023736
MSERPPVADWATDFDHLSEEWAAGGPEIMADLRERCPVASTERFYGAYLVTRHDDITKTARDTETFSNRVTAVNTNHPDKIKLDLSPITLDPPEHGPVRRPLLPSFSPKATAELEPTVVAMAERLLDGIGDRTLVDGALDYAQLLPVEVMSHLFGVSADMGPSFRRWVDGVIKEGQIDLDIARRAAREVQEFFANQLDEREELGDGAPDDLVTTVLRAEAESPDGSTRPFTRKERIGALFVLMLGGIDTTWSTLGSMLLHLGTHPDDLERLVGEPELMPTAIEEFLRFYSPVTIARYITEDADIAGCPVSGGKRVLLAYPSANRDPEYFDRPDEFILDRENNRHMAFGVGVHRCLGSNLARMELEVGLSAWLRRYPRFELAVDPSEVPWSVGPVRGPRSVPIRILG